MNSSFRKKLVTLLCAVGLALMLWGVTYPFVGIYNTNNNYLSLAARNYLRFGFVNLKFFPTYFAGAHFSPGDPYYLHHPIVVFLLEAVSLFIFGFHNWTVHAVQFFFVIGTIIMMYLTARTLWNTKVALWAAGLAALLPMTTFFWKYMQFEQASLLVNLIIYYFVLRHLRKPSNKTLGLIFLFTLFSGFVDWGVLYLLFPLSILFFTKYKKEIVKPFVVYIVGAVVSLGMFVAGVYIVQRGFAELGTAIWGRSYTAELTSLSLWPLRLIVLSVIRMVLYFTPIVFVAIPYAFRYVRNTVSSDQNNTVLSKMTLVIFFLYGCLNLIFLPAASWGHSYFLYYFIPFFAYIGGLFMASIEKKRGWLWFWLGIIIIMSVSVNYLKIQQVKKQLWKYDVAVDINKTLVPYETIGVVNFAGDIFENYFLHPSQPIPYANLNDWLRGVTYPGVAKALYVCSGTCTSSELATAQSLKSSGLAMTYEAGGNEAWLITKRLHSQVPVTEIVHPTNQAQIQEGNVFLKIYRYIRDTFGVGQI